MRNNRGISLLFTVFLIGIGAAVIPGAYAQAADDAETLGATINAGQSEEVDLAEFITGTITGVTGAAKGSTTFTGTIINYTANAGESGVDSISYTTSSGGSGVIMMNVTTSTDTLNPHFAPYPINNHIMINQNFVLDLNATDPDDETAVPGELGSETVINYEIISNNATGTKPDVDAGNGTISWTPNMTETVSITIRATIEPIIIGQAPGISDITLFVTVINEPPTITGPEEHDFVELEPGVLNFTAQDETRPNGNLTWSLQGEPAGMDITGTNTNAQIRWTPTEAQGNDTPITVNVTVSDGEFEASQNVTVTATEVNENPVFDTIETEQSATSGESFSLDVTATDADLPAQAVSYDIALHNATGAPPEINSDNGTISWTPDTVETVSITVRASDNFTTPGTANITITATVSDPLSPINATSDEATSNKVDTLHIHATANDMPDTVYIVALNLGDLNLGDPSPIQPNITSPDLGIDHPQNQSISNASIPITTLYLGDINHNDTHIIYQPSREARLLPDGIEITFQYTINAPNVTESAEANVTITFETDETVIEPIDAVNDAVTTAYNTPVSIDVLDNDTYDTGGPPLVPIISSHPEHGTLNFSANNITITYTPDTNYTGQDTFVYEIRDIVNDRVDDATVTITVSPPPPPPPPPTPTPVNTAPVAGDFAVTVAQSATVTVNLANAGHISDAEQAADTLTVSLDATPAATQGQPSIQGVVFTYVANDDAAGTDTLSYTVTDEGNLTDTATITVTIEQVISEPDDNDGDADDSWRKTPTFGRSFNTNELIVSCGYAMDGVCHDVTDYHVDYERQTIQTGSTHHFALKAYGEQTLSMFQIGFGMPGVGSPLNTAEALIEITVSPNYDPDSSGYDIVDVVYRNPNNVIDEDARVIVRDAVCGPISDLACVELEIRGVTFREQMHHEPFAIFVMDSDLRSSTFYMNDGLLVQGESLNPAPTATKPTKSGNQADVVTIQLTRTDKLANIWTDQIGNKWTQNEYGTWLMVYTVPKEITTACSDDSNRYCDAFKERLQTHNDILEDIRDGRYGNIYTTPAYDDLAEAITILDMDGDSRTRFLEQNGMMWVRADQ